MSLSEIIMLYVIGILGCNLMIILDSLTVKLPYTDAWTRKHVVALIILSLAPVLNLMLFVIGTCFVLYNISPSEQWWNKEIGNEKSKSV